ncbi:hypothetical protein NA57DRAFT_56799 [Rhizodiscina lignyota]|uniref:Uncharacterized protein n=1 Tax=Rhizodiscina lignyota TaxID=1504668 RepID=A0A9P4IHB5_9PEZI|nr:hypothetical protein NA57DRAFT_56799 [Rhizodiscina lignyota]
MSGENEKVTFGATIEPEPESPLAPPARQHLSTIIERDSKASSTMMVPSIHSSRPSTAGTNTNSPISPKTDYDPANPFSAFYEHPPARRSAEQLRSTLAQGAKDGTLVTEADVEAQLPPLSQQSTPAGQKPSVEVTKECQMWPSQKTLKAQRQEAKKKERMCKMCNCWGRLNKKQKILVQIVIALLVCGAAVGLGVGISKAVGGGVWASQGQTKSIGDQD